MKKRQVNGTNYQGSSVTSVLSPRTFNNLRLSTSELSETGEEPTVGLFDHDFSAAKVIYNKSSMMWNVGSSGRVLLQNS
jgi:hypothetical protein